MSLVRLLSTRPVRSSSDLAGLSGRDEARELLAGIYGRFSEGFRHGRSGRGEGPARSAGMSRPIEHRTWQRLTLGARRFWPDGGQGFPGTAQPQSLGGRTRDLSRNRSFCVIGRMMGARVHREICTALSRSIHSFFTGCGDNRLGLDNILTLKELRIP